MLVAHTRSSVLDGGEESWPKMCHVLSRPPLQLERRAHPLRCGIACGAKPAMGVAPSVRALCCATSSVAVLASV